MRGLRLSIILLALLAHGCSEECTSERCGNGRAYQSCVDGKDFVVRDEGGKEYSRCVSDYEDLGGGLLGEDRNGCRDKHAGSKVSFCEGSDPLAGNDAGPSPTGRPHCYRKATRGLCECYFNNLDGDFASPEWQKVTSCADAPGMISPTCCAYGGADGTDSCRCVAQARACRETGNSCRCPDLERFEPSEVRSSCQPSGGRICCISESLCLCGNEQQPGSGCVGFGGFNETATLIAGACTAPLDPIEICIDVPERTNCDGLTWKR